MDQPNTVLTVFHGVKEVFFYIELKISCLKKLVFTCFLVVFTVFNLFHAQMPSDHDRNLILWSPLWDPPMVVVGIIW